MIGKPVDRARNDGLRCLAGGFKAGGIGRGPGPWGLHSFLGAKQITART